MISALAQQFFIRDGIPTTLLYGNYNYGLVGLSVLVAIFSSCIALQLAGMARLSHGRANRQLALFTGALALGVGIWAMHFIGMQAFELCTPVTYDFAQTLFSMLPGLLAAWVALHFLARREITYRQLWSAAILVGLGIGSMHYSGMAAMRMAPLLRFDLWWFLASIVVAVLLSLLALWIRFGLRRQRRISAIQSILLGGLVMGCAIAGMHYTGMAAARFIGEADPNYSAGSNINYFMALSIALIAAIMAILAAAANALSRYRELYQRMLHNQSRTKAIVETAVDGIITINAKGTVQDVNQAVERMFGWRSDEVIGKNISMLMPEPFRSQHDGYLANYLRHGEARIIGIGREVMGQRKDGSLMPMRLAIGRAQMKGQPMFVGFVTDISARHAMEVDLRQAKERAEQAAEARATFLANMSHEIRTPMNAIIGFTELAIEEAHSTSQHRYLNTVRQAARGLLGLINDILDTAKLEKGAVEFECNDFSLRELCEQILATLELSASGKGLELLLDYPAKLPDYFKGDALRIQQVLLNLVGNAIKFTEKGRVTLAVRQQAEGMELAVIDTGIGIPGERLEKIFDPFAQADASTTRRFGGTGLGTTIARQLTEMMGGRITVQSEPGIGSTFRVSLPLQPGKEVQEAEKIDIVRLPPLRILVADDVPQNLELLEIALGNNGHQIVTASNGSEALAAIQKQVFDLVLMDVQMPVLDGLHATRQLRSMEQSAGQTRLPVIALTASVLEADYRAAREAGMDGYAAKPVDLPALFAEIGRVLKLGTSTPADATTHAANDTLPDGIDWVRGLALWGNRETLRKAIDRFCRDWPGARHDLLTALAATDTGQGAAIAHRLYGALGNLALPQAHAAAGRLEKAMKAEDMASADRLLEQLDAAISLSCPDEPTASEQAPEKEPLPAVDREQLRLLLAASELSLRQGELDNATLANLLGQLPSGQAGALEEAINNFDFDAAIRQLSALRSQLMEENPHGHG